VQIGRDLQRGDRELQYAHRYWDDLGWDGQNRLDRILAFQRWAFRNAALLDLISQI